MANRMVAYGLVAMLILMLSPVAVLAQGEECPANLLTNGDFDGSYSHRPDPYNPGGPPESQLGIADDWELWYDNVPQCPPGEPECDLSNRNHRPEYKPEDGVQFPDPLRVRSLPHAQKMFTTSSTHAAGIYQQVQVPPGSWVSFSIWVIVWSNEIFDPYESTIPGDYRVSVGIDPDGATEWSSDSIIWTEPVIHYDEYTQLSLTIQAISDTVTIYTRGDQKWAVTHNDSYWDDACLVVSVPPTTTPTSTAMPSPTPTRTPTTPVGTLALLCDAWGTFWVDEFDDPELSGWGINTAGGNAAVGDSVLRLDAGPANNGRYPLLWRNDVFLTSDELTFETRFRFQDVTVYGVGLGIGSGTYEGQRQWHRNPPPPGSSDILRIYHGALGFEINLLNEDLTWPQRALSALPLGWNYWYLQQPAAATWTGNPLDEAWHTVRLTLLYGKYSLYVDGALIGHATSSKRPESLYLGNPIVLEDWGIWTQIELDYVVTDRCDSWYWPTVYLPLVFKGWMAPVTPTPTSTVTPVPSIPTPTKTPQRIMEITDVKYQSSDEYVEIANGGANDQQMSGWRLVSLQGEQSYDFPDDFVLESGATVRIHSGPDALDNPPTDLFWRHGYIWRDSGDIAVLHDNLCREVSRWEY